MLVFRISAAVVVILVTAFGPFYLSIIFYFSSVVVVVHNSSSLVVVSFKIDATTTAHAFCLNEDSATSIRLAYLRLSIVSPSVATIRLD